MNETLSLRLDVLRMTGALMVFAAHASYLGYTGSSAGFAHHYGHTGVIVFSFRSIRKSRSRSDRMVAIDDLQ